MFGQSIVRGLLAATLGASLLTVISPDRESAQEKSEGANSRSKIRGALPVSKFYETPNPLAHQAPGTLIRSEDAEQYDLPAHIQAVRILYHSIAASGQKVVVSGVILLPDQKAPAAGWPVIAWAHDLNGVARECAPSLARNLQHGPFLSMYVNLGYAVVATDYAGLGTSSRNAFSDTQSNASDVLYSVPAARSALPTLGSRWVAIGYGQGGSAVMGLAELEHEIHDPNYLGSMAISGLDNYEDRYGPSAPQIFPNTPLFLTYGIKSVYPEFDVKEILTDKALALYPRVAQACGDPATDSKLSAADLLKPNWRDNKFVKLYFARNALGHKPGSGPMLVISSELDSTLPIQGTLQVITRLCSQGDRIQFERYPQSETGQVFGDSLEDQLAWIRARFAGRAAPRNCPERR